MFSWMKRLEHGEAVTLLAAWAWWLRAGAFVIVAAVVLDAEGASPQA